EDGRFNVALTTNFDDLLTDAFFYFQEVRPLVIHHDSLAPFIRPTYSRPLVAKLHGDHRLSPLNTPDETASLPKLVAQRVSTVLHDRGIIFLGYGGCDESIISMMEQLPDEAIPFGVYWVSGSEPRGKFRPWLESRGAVWVKNRDFDELMCRSSQSFEIDDPSKDRHERVLNRYVQTKTTLLVEIAKRKAESIEDAMFKASVAIAVGEVNRDPAKNLFDDAIESFPDCAPLLGQYADFLKEDRNELGRAEEFYKRAIEADPKHANNLGDFANFLTEDRRDVDRAEDFYKRAIEADPTHANNLGNYANFLAIQRKDLDGAGEFYKRSIEADPHNPHNPHRLCIYAVFLAYEQEDLGEAEEFYKRAIETDPKNADNLGYYAAFLDYKRKDLGQAEEFYKRAIEADPEHADNLKKYADFQYFERKDLGRAEEYYKRAIEADPQYAASLGGYARFLALGRNDAEGAEVYFKRAIEADPKDIYCRFNFGVSLLIRGFTASGFTLIEEALACRSTTEDDKFTVVAAFHFYVHGPTEKQGERLTELRRLIEADVRATGWKPDLNIARAMKDGHSGKAWLKKLAAVITEEANPSTLNRWKAWREARPKTAE
ncbi:MAG: Tfp pilus assembly protein PilF, partial [Planctomycetaceae bacterium]